MQFLYTLVAGIGLLAATPIIAGAVSPWLSIVTMILGLILVAKAMCLEGTCDGENKAD